MTKINKNNKSIESIKNHIKENNELPCEYDSDESPDNYDSSKYEPDMEVEFNFEFSSKNRKEIDKVWDNLFNNNFQLSPIYKDDKRKWHSNASRRIFVKDNEATERLVDNIFLESKASCGYYHLSKITN